MLIPALLESNNLTKKIGKVQTRYKLRPEKLIKIT